MTISQFSAIPALLLCVCALPHTAGAAGAYPNSFPATPMVGAGGIRADDGLPTTPAYNIETYDYYCTGGGTYCKTPSAFLPGANFGVLLGVGMPGQTAGAPLAFIAECAHLYMNNGVITSDLAVIDTSPFASSFNRTVTQFGWGGITGDPTESGVSTIGTFNANATESRLETFADYYGGQYHFVTVPFTVTASITGNNVNNNATDTSLGGPGFAMYFKGNFIRETWNPGTQQWSFATLQTGTVSCTVGGPHANDLVSAGLLPSWEAYSEAEYEGSAP